MGRAHIRDQVNVDDNALDSVGDSWLQRSYAAISQWTAGPFARNGVLPPVDYYAETGDDHEDTLLDELTVGQALAKRPQGYRIHSRSMATFADIAAACRNHRTVAYGDDGLLDGAEQWDRDPYFTLVRATILSNDAAGCRLQTDQGEDVCILPGMARAFSSRAESTFGAGEAVWAVIDTRERPMARNDEAMHQVAYMESDQGPLNLPLYVPSPAGSLVRWRAAQALTDVIDLGFNGRYDEVAQNALRVELRRWVDGDDTGPVPAAEIADLASWVVAVLSAPGHTARVRWWEDTQAAESTTAATTMPPVMPGPRLVKTARQAEEYAAEVMRGLGFADARVTGVGADEGIDVVSDAAVAQVKMEGVVTGRPVVQALFGIAAAEAKLGVFFSLAGYTAGALEWANRVGVACFEFAFDGTITASNDAATELVAGHGPSIEPPVQSPVGRPDTGRLADRGW